MTPSVNELLGPELAVLLAGAVPVGELRTAIPLGAALGLSPAAAFFWAAVGNLLPVAPLLVALDDLVRWARRFERLGRFFDWYYRRTERKSAQVARLGALGLFLFVAIPLPMTGAYSGCVAASIFRIPFRLAFPAIAGGVLAAGVIVMALTASVVG